LSLTKNGEKALADNQKLFESIFKAAAIKFNWAYYDNFEEEQIGKMGFGFTFILLAKYGHQKQLNSFYSKKYFKAFPMLLEELIPSFDTLEKYADLCYSLRTFQRIFSFFGLVKIEQTRDKFDEKNFITKTKIFTKLVKVQPPQNV